MLFEVKKQTIPSTVLSDKYIVPPFSVFNTRQEYWRERQRMWNELGIGGTNGRVTSNNGLTYDNRRMDKYAGKGELNGTSAFSPVLTEIMYKWFTVQHSQIYDPFAGGITRGVIGAILGHNYLGVDINPVQVDSNLDTLKNLQNRLKIEGKVDWIVNNSTCFCNTNFADFIITCPPYYNLEKYTDDENDLSNCTSYQKFLFYYRIVLCNCYATLKDDSFMVWVVSDIRDKETTEYYGLVADTITAAREWGFKLYNEIILYNDTSNLAIVSGDYLEKARKVGRQHQNVLVFYKGDTKHIKEKFGPLTK